MPRIVQNTSWAEFKAVLSDFARMSRARRESLLFRGQSDSAWLLRPTLDRDRTFRSDDARQRTRMLLIREFQREALGLSSSLPAPSDNLSWELLARHHGLPTTIMDWSRSPYVASYFAFVGKHAPSSQNVAVWMLDRSAFARMEIPEIEIVDSDAALAVNPRAIEQRGVFLRVNANDRPLETVLGDALTRFDIPASERKTALTDLDNMRLSSRSLFRDLDSAAVTASMRYYLSEGSS